MLSATSPPHHLRVFSTLLCLFSSSSNSLLSCYPLISPYMPPISELAALVSFCPPHVTQPLSCVVCLNSTILPLSALVTLTIFRTQFFRILAAFVVVVRSCPLVFWCSDSPPSPPQPLSTRSLRPVLFDSTPSISTLLCLFSSSSNSLLSCYPLISPYMPPISELAALVSFCPPHVTQPLSCVVCLNSTILPLSALVTLTIFRTQFFRILAAFVVVVRSGVP